jgi:hypothetical protein
MRILQLHRSWGIGPVSLRNGAIELGQRGRGRTLALVPVLDVDPSATKLEWPHARVGRTSEGGIVLAPCPGCNDDRLLLVVRGEPTYRRGLYCPAVMPPWGQDRVEGVEVLASGQGAWGDAGRLGGWEEALLLVRPGYAFVLTNRYSYQERLVMWDGRDLYLQTREEWAAGRNILAAIDEEVTWL